VLLNLDNYLLRAYYSRKHFKKGGTCIYIQNSLKTTTINLDIYCCDKDIEACAVRLTFNNYRICIVAVYRSPSSNYSTFLIKMEIILQKICKNNVKVIICGDINVNFMDDCPRKRQLEILLKSFNLSSIVTFPTRIGLNKSTIIDNIFIDKQQYDGYDILTVSNGLSDHEAQLLVLNLPSPIIIEKHINYTRNINNYNIYDFQTKLSYEN
jgi:exonuclease III